MISKEIADFLLRSRQCEIDGLKHLMDASEMLGFMRELIHALQRERGASNLFLESQGHCYAERLAKYRTKATEAEQQLRRHFAIWLQSTLHQHATSRFYAHVALALQGLEELPKLRQNIDLHGIDASKAMDSFNELVRRLLAVAFEAADPASDPGISSALVSLLNFMQGKELAGQERAVGVAGFGQGWRDALLRPALTHRIDAQERCFQIFSEFASSSALNHWQALLSSPSTTEVERLRRIAISMSPDEAAGFELAQIWFDVATRRIDAMKVIEDQLELFLRALCETRLAQAQAGLLDDEAKIAELARQGGATLPVGIVMGRPMDAADPGLLLYIERNHVGGGSNAIGRSLLDLVQMQSLRLRSMEDELHAAREALAERKIVEQAKALLIKHRGMSEDEAHRVLRKTAMDQGKRLIEVARAVISMAEMLAPGSS